MTKQQIYGSAYISQICLESALDYIKKIRKSENRDQAISFLELALNKLEEIYRDSYKNLPKSK